MFAVTTVPKVGGEAVATIYLRLKGAPEACTESRQIWPATPGQSRAHPRSSLIFLSHRSRFPSHRPPSIMSGILFEDMFNVESIDNARYNKVSRIEAQSSTSQDIKITLDINRELFPVKDTDSLTIALASSLGNESSMLTSNGSWRPPKRGDRSLADDYDYVMYGTVYKFEESSDNDKMAVYISFGGLLMRLEGGYRSLSNLKQENAYILIRHYKDN